MATYSCYFNFTTGTDPAGAWTSDAGAFDGATGNPAVAIIGTLGTVWSAKPLQASGNDAPTTGFQPISSVSIVVYFSFTQASHLMWVVPIFGGSSAGSSQSRKPTSTGSTFYVFPITADAKGPGAGNWTWDAINALDVQVFPQSCYKSGGATCAVECIRILVEGGLGENAKKLYYQSSVASVPITLYNTYSTLAMSTWGRISLGGSSVGYFRLEPESCADVTRKTKLRVYKNSSAWAVWTS